MRPVGYLLNKREELEGEAGLFYDYILAGNGLFIRAQNPLIRGTVCIALEEIRGLSTLDEQIELVHGKMPRFLYDLALSLLLASSERERYLAITWENEYRLRIPSQERAVTSVEYQNPPSSIMDIHSHGGGAAWFSTTDNTDEQGLRFSMVVGKLNTLLPEVEIRLGVYGYFAPVTVEEVFDGK